MALKPPEEVGCDRILLQGRKGLRVTIKVPFFGVACFALNRARCGVSQSGEGDARSLLHAFRLGVEATENVTVPDSCPLLSHVQLMCSLHEEKIKCTGSLVHFKCEVW